MALSTRGNSWAKQGPDMIIWKVIPNLWDPVSNPDGYVSLGVAENSLMHDELTAYINTHTKISPRGLTYGDGGAGSKECRAAMAHFLTRKLHPVVPIQASHVCITNGVTTAIEHISTLIANPRDVFLLGQPYYGAFIDDIELRTDVEVFPVAFGDIDPLSLDAVSAYASAIKTCQAKGKRVAGLMLCNPHNPLGRCYPREFMIELMKLCNEHKIHLVSDEIYANSVFQKSGVPFTSLSSIPTDGLIDPSLTHILYGLSKDFCANGIRIGAIISQHHPRLHAALIPVVIYSYASSLVESLVTVMLNDDEFVDNFIATNHQRLKTNYDLTASWAESHGIEYVKGVNTAFFLWVDLGAVYNRKSHNETPQMSKLAVQENSDDTARPHNVENPEITTDMTQSKNALNAKIQDALLSEKVFLASGTAFGSERPGWFRIVFSQDERILREGLRRIEKALGSMTT